MCHTAVPCQQFLACIATENKEAHLPVCYDEASRLVATVHNIVVAMYNR